MSTFYVLPPRPLLAEHLAGYIRNLLPGLTWSKAPWNELADALRDAAAQERDVFVVYREELPDPEQPLQGLADGFGAEAGDEVIEVRAGTAPGQLTVHHRRLGAA